MQYHPENNCRLLIDNLFQLEEDFNSRTEKLRSGGVGLLSQTRPIPRSPDGDNKAQTVCKTHFGSQGVILDGF